MLLKTLVFLLLLCVTEGYPENTSNTNMALIMLVVYGTVLVGVTLKYVNELFNIPIPFELLILLGGCTIGYLKNFYLVGGIMQSVSDEDAFLLNFALPVLLFKLCLCMEINYFNRCLYQILIIAIPCTIINGYLVGYTMSLVENAKGWSFDLELMYGFASISIYPQESLTNMRNLGSKGKHLSSILEGESIIGSIVCIIFIEGAYKHQNGTLITTSHFIQYVLQYIFGGFVLGCVAGYVLSKLMRIFYNDTINVIILTISAPFMAYFIGIYLFKVCGSLALIIIGIFMCFQRAELYPETETFLIYFWDILSLIVICLVFTINGMFFGEEIRMSIKLVDLVKIVIMYMLVYFSRFITFICFSFFVSKFENGISIRYMIVAAWGGFRGAITLCLITYPYLTKDISNFFRGTMLIHLIGVVFLSLLINVPTITALMNCLGISNISSTKMYNMNCCIHYVMSKKDRVLSLLKMDRFLADANWTVVSATTTLKHPYRNQRINDSQSVYTGANGRTQQYQTAFGGIGQMRGEARMRILQAKKISYAKQYDTGMLSRKALGILNNEIETAQDDDDDRPKSRIEPFLKLFRRKSFPQIFKNHLMKYFNNKIFSITPELSSDPNQGKIHKIISHPLYFMLNYFVTLCAVACAVYELTLTDYTEEKMEMNIMKFANSAFLIIFSCDILLKIYGSSPGKFIRNPWNIFDICMWLITFADVVVDVLDLSGIFLKYDTYVGKTTIFLKLLRAAWLLRMITLCNIFYPLLLRICDRKIDSKLFTLYDVGKGFVKGQEDVLEMLDEMIPNEDVREEMRKSMENDKLAISRELGILQKEKPWIAITVKTKQAIKTILSCVEASIDDLRVSGWIDHIEYKKLMESLNEKRKSMRKIKMINSSPPKVIVQEIAWIHEENYIIEYLFDRVVMKIYEPGDIVCKSGEKPSGVFIIISGLFKSTYKPNKQVLQALENFGILPIIDYISVSQFDEIIEDYIVSGNCIGELSYLTGRPYCANVIAETTSQVYILPTEVLNEAANINPNVVNGFKAKMWKYTVLKLAAIILMKTLEYKSASREKLLYALERCFVPNLEKFKCFINNSLIEDIILIEGTLTDTITKETYIAPCYIPRSTETLELMPTDDEEVHSGVSPKLLIIPIKDISPSDIIETEEIAESNEYQNVEMIQDFARNKRISVNAYTKSGRNSLSRTSMMKSKIFSSQAMLTLKNYSHDFQRDFNIPDFRRRDILYVSENRQAKRESAFTERSTASTLSTATSKRSYREDNMSRTSRGSRGSRGSRASEDVSAKMRKPSMSSGTRSRSRTRLLMQRHPFSFAEDSADSDKNASPRKSMDQKKPEE